MTKRIIPFSLILLLGACEIRDVDAEDGESAERPASRGELTTKPEGYDPVRTASAKKVASTPKKPKIRQLPDRELGILVNYAIAKTIYDECPGFELTISQGGLNGQIAMDLISKGYGPSDISSMKYNGSDRRVKAAVVKKDSELARRYGDNLCVAAKRIEREEKSVGRFLRRT